GLLRCGCEQGVELLFFDALHQMLVRSDSLELRQVVRPQKRATVQERFRPGGELRKNWLQPHRKVLKSAYAGRTDLVQLLSVRRTILLRQFPRLRSVEVLVYVVGDLHRETYRLAELASLVRLLNQGAAFADTSEG